MGDVLTDQLFSILLRRKLYPDILGRIVVLDQSAEALISAQFQACQAIHVEVVAFWKHAFVHAHC